MLKDDLKEIKREMPDGLEIQTGACSFCGQMGQIETLIPWDQEKVNEAVTELCDCYGAKEYARKKRTERTCVQSNRGAVRAAGGYRRGR